MRIARLLLAAMVLGLGERALASEPTSITCETLRKIQVAGKGPAVLDVRYEADYRRRHVEGAQSVPFFKLSSYNGAKDAPVVVYCSGIGCSLSSDAAVTLSRRGYTKVSVLYGGIAEWEMKGYPVVREPEVIAAAGGVVTAAELKGSSRKILDVRPVVEYQAGHVPGALSAPLETLATRAKSLSGEVVVYDRDPARAKKAAELLKALGIGAYELSGGIAVWAKTGNPLEVGGGS